jgi:hypothetical protein
VKKVRTMVTKRKKREFLLLPLKSLKVLPNNNLRSTSELLNLLKVARKALRVENQEVDIEVREEAVAVDVAAEVASEATELNM